MAGQQPRAAGGDSRGARSLDDIMSLQPEYLLQFFEQNAVLLPQLRAVDPSLADAIQARDAPRVRAALMMQQMVSHKRKWERETEMARLEANPDDPDNQRRIEDIIRKENIESNLAMAIEETPESFGRVTMLYIDIEINQRSIKAFVDSGAQMTIMSLDLAERCGLTHLIDRRFAGEARGVGTGKILGRIHMSHVKIGGTFFPCSFTILERSDVEFLLGLDQLRRHQCVLDLRANVLRFGSTEVEVPFLGEADLPAHARGTTEADLRPDANTTTAMEEDAAITGSATANEGGGASRAAAAGAAPQQQQQGSDGGGAAKVAALTGLGFSEQQARAALESTNGDVEEAAVLLMAQMGG